MAAGQVSKTEKEVVKVCCGECKHFKRDTEGRSYSRETGEYFMGVCGEGLTPDTPKKQFANKVRVCILFKRNDE